MTNANKRFFVIRIPEHAFFSTLLGLIVSLIVAMGMGGTIVLTYLFLDRWLYNHTYRPTAAESFQGCSKFDPPPGQVVVAMRWDTRSQVCRYRTRSRNVSPEESRRVSAGEAGLQPSP
ncbi:hypothetical protein OOK60_05980 [Trichothermofontia sichuanensis B231]|uniref:hypothetical protein n=1 Tax=Trichothermofontia sichuanensis TaxID=3045816 RepID=UPI00224700CA|nr:hypothetical protein [Trichothermofontia sichuanensis]UZQ55618.1 hypothetical protein OOK60_05980 [Trichothermofontia sichuanensis B231]